MKRYIFIIIFLLIVAAIGVKLIPTDRNRIQKVIDSCKTALLNNDISGLMENVSFNYSDDYGDSYLLLKKRMEGLLMRFSDFEITVDMMGIKVDEKSAEADLKVSVIASEEDDRGYLIGDAGWPQDMKVYFEKSPALQWKIMRVERVDRSTKNDNERTANND
jgi:hypothetical protein